MGIQIKDFGDAIINLLGDELYKKSMAVEKLVEKTSPKILAAIKATSPTRSKKYRKGWKLDKAYNAGKLVYTAHNKTHYRLTHLLEDGTADRKTTQGKGRGKAPKQPHIRAAVLPILEDFKRDLRNI